MSAGAWVALLTTGCFCTVACYANGAFPSPKARTFAEKQVMASTKPKQAVDLWKRVDTLADRRKAEAAGLGVVDTVVEVANQVRGDCGENFACLLAWADGGR